MVNGCMPYKVLDKIKEKFDDTKILIDIGEKFSDYIYFLILITCIIRSILHWIST